MSRKRFNRNTPISTAELTAQTLKRYQPMLEPADFTLLAAEINKPLTPSIRINLLKSNPQQLVQSLHQLYGWELKSIPFCSSGYCVTLGQQTLSSAIEHRMGFFYIQEGASMLPAELFEYGNKSHPLVLDMAASPGGKTIHLADKTLDQGLIIANDSSRTRIKALQIVLQNWGVINQAVTCLPGERFGDLLPNTFDMVLLDAPCSMEGLRTTESHPMRPITDKERFNLTLRQQRLLESALKTVRVGGQVVYSTCTLAPEEDEAVLAALLAKFPDKFEINDSGNKLPVPAPGLTSDGKNQFPHVVQQAIRLWPQTCDTAGFFAARLNKINAIPSEKQVCPKTSWQQWDYQPLKEREINDLNNQINLLYGFSMEDLLNQQDLGIWQREAEIRLIPNLLLEHFPDFQAVSKGIQLGRWIESEIALSHEFVARFGSQFQNGKIILEDEFLPAWLRGEDLRGYNTRRMQKGIAVMMDQWGRNLGRGKILTDRLKNLLPNRLF